MSSSRRQSHLTRLLHVRWLLVSWLGGCCFSGCRALNPIEIRGYKFFDTVTGDEFRIRGIDYYPRPNAGDLNHNSLDYFTEEHRHIWERDLPYLQELGVNAIRIYAINSFANHDAFFCTMERAGIYVMIELARDCPGCAIDQDAAPSCYPPQLKLQGQDVIRQMSQYSNVLGFSAGNEVNHYAPTGFPQRNAPCQKKFLRDMRQYVESCSATMRRVPIGLVAADSDRDDNALYYNCQSNVSDPYENAEWFGLNSYVNCDGNVSTYKGALGFNSLQESFASYNYSIPVVLTEFGCVSKSFPKVDGYEGQRNFRQFYWLHTIPSVRDQFAGGFAFEFSMEMENAKSESPYPFTKFGHANYGVGYFRPEDCDDIKIPCTYVPLPNFDSLRLAYQNVTNITIPLSDYEIPSSRQGRSICPKGFPALNEFDWEADHLDDLACPSSEQPAMFVCPANLDDLRPKPPLSSKLYLWTMAVVASFLMSLVFTYMLRRIRDANEQAKMQLATVVLIPKYRRSDCDMSSNESEGLLKEMPKGDYYHAIESDTSSEEGK